MVVYNFTKIKRREKRLYSIFNTTVSKTGLATNTIYTSIAMLILFSIPGLIICKITGTFWYNPLLIASNPNVGYFYVFFIGMPIALATALNTCKIQNYKIIDYLKMYIAPKHMIDHNGKRVNINGIKIDAFIEKI